MEKRYKPGEFAKLVNRTVGTLRKWDREGKLTAKRMPSGHRYYTRANASKIKLGAATPHQRDCAIAKNASESYGCYFLRVKCIINH